MTYAPCELNSTISPVTIAPIGWLPTNSRNGSASLIGSVGRTVRPRPRPRPLAGRESPIFGVSPGAALNFGTSIFGRAFFVVVPGRDAPLVSEPDDAALVLRRGDRMLVFEVGSVFLRASRVDRRLSGPRTGDRSTNTQPMPGTGLPPISRPSSKSQSC